MNPRNATALNRQPKGVGNLRRGLRLCAVGLVFYLAAPCVWGVTNYYWSGANPTNNLNWQTAGNWVSSNLPPVPQTGDNLIFPLVVTKWTSTNDFSAGTEFSSLAFGGSNFVLRGNLIGLRSGGIQASNSSGINSNYLPIRLVQDQIFACQKSGATLLLGGTIDLNGRNLQVWGDGTNRFEAPLTNSGGVSLFGGTLVFAGNAANTFTGLVTNLFGTMLLSKNSGVTAIPGPLGVGLTLGPSESAIVRLTANDQISDQSAVTLGDGGLLDLQYYTDTIGSLAGSGLVKVQDGGSTLGVGPGNASSVFAGTFSGNGYVRKLGTGILALQGPSANTNASFLVEQGELDLDKTSGVTAIPAYLQVGVSSGAVESATVRVLKHNQFSSQSSVFVSSDGLLDLGSYTSTIWSLGGSGRVNSGTSASLGIGLGGDFSGVLSGGGGLSLLGTASPRTLSLSGSSPNTLTGAVAVAAGTLELRKDEGVTAIAGPLQVGDGSGLPGSATARLFASGQIASQSAVTVNADGLLDLAGYTNTIGSLAGSGQVTNSTNGLLVIGQNGLSTGFSGRLAGEGTVIKVGAGMLTLSGNSANFSGGITLSNGALALGHDNAFGSGPVAMQAGTTLATAGGRRVLSNALSAVGSGTIVLDTAGGDLELDNTFYPEPALSKQGANSLILPAVASLSVSNFDVRGGAVVLDGGYLNQYGYLRLHAVAGDTTRLAVTNYGQCILNSGSLALGYTGIGTNLLEVSAYGWVTVSNLIVGSATGAVAVVNQRGDGSVTVIRGVYLGASNSTGIYNLEGGTLSTPRISPGNAAGVSQFNFNGGVLQGTSASLLQGLTQATIKDGGAIIEVPGGSATIAQNLDGSGSLTKLGAGTLTLSGTNDYAGSNVVAAGKLVVNTAQAGGGSGYVLDGAALGVTLVAPGGSLVLPSLVLGETELTNTALEFNLGTSGNPTAPVIIASNLVATSSNLISVSGQNLSLGQFPLIAYSNNIGGQGAAAFTLANPPRSLSAQLVFNSPNSSVDLNITAVNPVVWKGSTDTNWDIGSTTNWYFNNGPTTYQEGDVVLFDDTASRRDVYLKTNVSPNSITVSNALANPYSFAGTGRIGGAAGLRKLGAGTLTIATFNTFNGGVMLSNGTLRLGSVSALVTLALAGGRLSSDSVTNRMLSQAVSINGEVSLGAASPDSGPLAFTRAMNLANDRRQLTVDSEVEFRGGSTNGRVRKLGAGKLTLRGTNVWNGNAELDAGSLLLQGTLAVSGVTGSLSGSLMFDGGVLRATADNANFIAGLGSIIVANTNRATLDTLSNTITLSQTITNDGTYNGGRLLKDGSGTLYLNNTNYLGDLELTNGTLAGTGRIAGTLIIYAKGVVAPGQSLGTLTVTGGVSFTEPGGKMVMEISRDSGGAASDCFKCYRLNNASHGSVIVTNVGTNSLQSNDEFQLFVFDQPMASDFASLTLPLLNPPLWWDTNRLRTNGIIQVRGPAAGSQPRFALPAVSGNNLILSGTGGPPSAAYYLLTSTDVARPLSNWAPWSTHYFDSTGSFSNAWAMTNAADKSRFFMIRVP